MEELVPRRARVADPLQLCKRVRRRVGGESQWRAQFIQLVVTRVGLAKDGRAALPRIADDA